MMLLLTILFCLNLTVITCTSNCENFETCSACIQTTLDTCVWCSADNHIGKRCQSKNYHLKNGSWCMTKAYEPETIIDIPEPKDWSTKIQLKPQYVKIKSSPGVPVDITMTYKPAKDAPLEVYFLMDNSETMNKHKENLANQGLIILTSLNNLTNNVRLGLGSFVEKPAIPYATRTIHNSYSFKNHLSLTNDTTEFSNTLKNLRSGSNYDHPEALFDGLMQAMVCKKEIDWKNEARRIIVAFTDASYHSAGDGKMIGAFKPNDMKCHSNGSMDTVLDYPSVTQINKVAKENGYVIIFAVDEKIVKNIYKVLSQNIIGSKYVALNGKMDIAEMITNEYKKILKTFEITTSDSQYVEVKTKKNCSNCIVMHFQPLELITTFKVMSCPPPPKTKEFVTINPTSLNEAITVEIEFDCTCECEKDINTELNSAKCNKAGSYQCGICKCNSLRYGENCQCEGDVWDTKEYGKCKMNINDTLYCSGRGECRCGKCDPCHKGYSGQYCQFNDNACPRRGGLLCSGNGQCTMGKCNCYSKWTSRPNGPLDCGCSTDERSCIAPHSNKICSGNGKCVCKECVCDRKENANDTCSGRFCDNCKEVAEERCEELKDYAYCFFLNKTSCKDMHNTTDTVVMFANKSEINSPNRAEWYMANWCRVKMEDDDKIFVFKYYYRVKMEAEEDTNEMVLVIQRELEIPPPADIWVPVGSALGGILLIGLLTLILWKVLTDLYYEREYKKFEQKAKEAGYDVTLNPWYEPPVMNFINPAHSAN